MQKVNLCESCSKEKGVNDPTGFALADLLLGLGAAHEIEKNPSGDRCPVCGFSQGDFKKTGRLGCSACYDSFAEGLSGMLKNMHRGLLHTGKVPAKLALAEEHFEEAAALRDKIRLLEAEATVLLEAESVNRIPPLPEILETATSGEAKEVAPKPRKK